MTWILIPAILVLVVTPISWVYWKKTEPQRERKRFISKRDAQSIEMHKLIGESRSMTLKGEMPPEMYKRMVNGFAEAVGMYQAEAIALGIVDDPAVANILRSMGRALDKGFQDIDTIGYSSEYVARSEKLEAIFNKGRNQ